MSEQETTTEEEYFEFLNDLREIGDINMLAASPYLRVAFGISKRESRAILARWIEQFGQEEEEET